MSGCVSYNLYIPAGLIYHVRLCSTSTDSESFIPGPDSVIFKGQLLLRGISPRPNIITYLHKTASCKLQPKQIQNPDQNINPPNAATPNEYELTEHFQFTRWSWSPTGCFLFYWNFSNNKKFLLKNGQYYFSARDFLSRLDSAAACVQQ